MEYGKTVEHGKDEIINRFICMVEMMCSTPRNAEAAAIMLSYVEKEPVILRDFMCGLLWYAKTIASHLPHTQEQLSDDELMALQTAYDNLKM